MSGFSTFIPGKYIQPTDHFITSPGVPLPTNSWAQNAVKGIVIGTIGAVKLNYVTFSPDDRDTKPVPWFVAPYYGDGLTPEPFFVLDHSEVGDILHSTDEGQNSITYLPKGFIDKIGRVAPNTTLNLTNLDDESATYSFSNGTRFHTSRGSPFIVVRSIEQEEISILFAPYVTLLGPTIVTASSRDNFRYLEVPFSRQQATISTITSYPTSGVYTLSIPIYSRYSRTDTLVIQKLTFNSTGQPQTGNFISNEVDIGRFVEGIFSSSSGAVYDSSKKTITGGGLEIVLSGTSFSVTNNETVEGTIFFLSRDKFSMSRTDRTLVISTSPDSSLWIYINDSYAYYEDPNLGYVTAMIASQTSNGSYSLSLSSGDGTSLYLYTPRWWKQDYKVSSLRYLKNTIYDVTYRDCRLSVTKRSILTFTPRVSLCLPLLPSLPSELNLEAFKERVVLDTEYYAQFSLEDYKIETMATFGQNVAKYGRILTFAQVTGVITPDMYISFVSLLVSWLNETNGQAAGSAPGSNTLVHETTWGGIIVLSDYNLDLGISSQGSSGNSFYYDHHFQYGYFFSALYTLHVIDQDSVLITYQNQVLQLLQDVVTAAGDATSIATKTRHKDWYFGHSFGIGVADFVDFAQGAVSEAINCYYQAWLLSGAMFSLTSDPRYESMQAVSQAILYSEIAAYRHFWTQNGEDLDAPSTSTVRVFSKTIAAFTGRPTSYPSVSLNRYLSIAIPFTDITPLFIDKNWISRFSNRRTPDWQRADKDLVAGLCNYEKQNVNSWSYVPIPSPYDNNNDKSPEGITAWGFLGLQLLALGSAITDNEAVRYYNKVVNKSMDLNMPLDTDIIRRSDSLSNAFYVLYVQSRYNKIPPTSGPGDENTRSNSSEDKLVNVPTIDMLAVPTKNRLNVALVTFTIVDTVDWSNATRCDAFDKSIPTGLVSEEDVYVTEITLSLPECNFNSVLNASGTSLLQKCRNMNANVAYVVQYTYMRWVLSSLLFGSFKLKYLRRSFTAKFMDTLVRSRFSKFYSEYFNSTSLIDYNVLLYDVVGYGDVPQNGQLYFIR